MNKRLPPAIFLMGPTASGKSELAVALAFQLNCEIISVDSVMVYRGMDIGSAKPSVAAMEGIPHYLIDILDPEEAYSTGRFREQALEMMSFITEKGKIPLLVGGTMLYFNALLRGLAQLPAADVSVRRQIDREAGRYGWAAMHRVLAEIDPAAAARIHPNDPQRIQRALEVYRISGQTLTDLQAQSRKETIPFDVVKLIVAPEQRSVLHLRIERRFSMMLEQGLIEEVQTLLERKDLSDEMPSIRAVGYRQIWGYLQGRYDKETMIDRAVVATRQLAKRQLTWLRKEQTAFHYRSENSELLSVVLNDVGQLLR
jgi:tRNA dimethylallyltransferase